MLLSVLSALARLDLDPWFEAASLSRLPTPAATQRLASLLSTLPTQFKTPAPATIARLVGLLPQAAKEKAWPGDAVVAAKSKLSWPFVALIVVGFAMMFAGQYATQQKSQASGIASPAAGRADPRAAKARGE